MIILVDQDDTLADFDAYFLAQWRARYPHAPFVLPAQRRSFYLREDYPPYLRQQVEDLYCTPGFFRQLPPMAGGLEALQQMLALGHDVRICSAPIARYEHCVLEKFQWVEQHLGRDFTARLMLTYDKTLVRGDILIDDRPSIAGACVPEWEHVLFDRPYNRHVQQRRRLDWSNWRAVLGL